MGLGSVLGNAMDGWNDSADNRRKDELMAQKAAAHSQNTAIRGQKMELQKMQMQQARQKAQRDNSPEAQALRAAEIKAKTAAFKGEAEMYNYAMSDDNTGAAATQEVKNKVAEVEQKFEDKANVDHTVNTASKINTEFMDGGSISPNSIKDFNQVINSNPEVFRNMFQNDVVLWNPNNEDHKNGLYELANKTIQMQGIDTTKLPDDKAEELTTIMRDSLEMAAKRGFIVADSETGKANYITSLFGMTDVNQKLPQNIANVPNKELEQIGKEAADNYKRKKGLNEVPGWKQNEETNAGLKTWNGKDPHKAEMLFNLTKTKMPKGLEKVLEHNANLITPDKDESLDSFWTGAKPEDIEEALPNQIAELSTMDLDDPNRDVLLSRAKTGADLLKDEKSRTAMRKSIQLAEQYAQTTEIFKAPEAAALDDKKVAWMVTTESQNKKGLDKDSAASVETVKKTVAQSERVNGILSKLQAASKDGKLIVGYGAGIAKSGLATDENVYNRAKESLAANSDGMVQAQTQLKNAVTEADKKAARKKVDGLLRQAGNDLDKMIHNTTSIDTALGLELAMFIKEMSGASVSDQERDFLIGIVQGIQRGRPDVVGVALESFRDQRLAGIDYTVKDPTMRMAAPYTMYKGTMASSMKGRHYDMGKVKPIGDYASDAAGGVWDSFKKKVSDIVSPEDEATTSYDTTTSKGLNDLFN